MSASSVQSPARARPIARLWTWTASIVLTLVAAPVAVGGVTALLHWNDWPHPQWPADGQQTLLNLPFLRSYPAQAIGIVSWLAAWGLHLYASRRRRMSIFHVAVPAAVFLIFVVVAFFMPPPTPLS
jgi:H+/Cl- antiporter ClcA